MSAIRSPSPVVDSPGPSAGRQVEDTDSISACSGDSRYKSIRPSILKQLAEDIETSGGIASFIKSERERKDQKLSRLLNDNEEAYGKRGDPLRRDIQQKVNYWILLFRKGRYKEKVLERYDVESFEAREALKKREPQEKQETKENQSAEDRSDSDGNSSVSSEENQEEEVQEDQAQEDQAQEEEEDKKPAAQPIQAVPSPPSEIKISNRKQQDLETMSSSPRKAIPNGAHHVAVDLEYPERNREVYVYEVDELVGVGSFQNQVFKGFYVLFPIEARYVRDDPRNVWYSLKVVSPNQALLKMPGAHYAMQSNDDRKNFNQFLPESVVKSIDKKRNDYVRRRKNGEAGWKYILLTFPECQPGTEFPLELTTSPINEKATEEQWAKFESFPISFRKEISIDWTASAIQCSACSGYPNVSKEQWGGFAIAMKNTNPNMIGAVEEEGESDVAAMLRQRGGLF